MLIFHLCVSFLCLTLARSHPLSSVANELRDLATQKSVVMSTGIATVIKDFRDGIIATVERRSLTETASELDRALEELMWSMYYFDGMNPDFSDPETDRTAKRRVAQSLQTAKDHIDLARDQIRHWAA
ncbi:uncharacterized protein N7498_009928 [Penicillium cinerascens]|uniref:Uncharacterized protein n=1 Tax=Penicillium cinerascens TaxID=70096 RepID=A0A9W9M6R0_9EURO|nr:uncharacterized protein N7498_009928 [Penicillium cinerascens]KAJ5190943.1 hypothetical protein N7498_009928 [Penicillium cinerascens]